MSSQIESFDHRLERGLLAERDVAEHLVTHFYAAIHAFALSMLHDDDEADEVAQQTMIRAASRIGQYQPHTNLRAWMYKIGVNVCRAVLQKRKRRQRLLGLISLGLQSASEPSPERIAEQSERDAALWRAINTLSDKHRVPLILRYSHDLTTSEIADILTLPQGTVRSRLHYAQRTLHGILTAAEVSA